MNGYDTMVVYLVLCSLPHCYFQGRVQRLDRILGQTLYSMSGSTAVGQGLTAHSPSLYFAVLGPRVLPHPRDADRTLLTSTDSETVHYHYGPKDLVTILFYIFITIILHALVQEYILDVSVTYLDSEIRG